MKYTLVSKNALKSDFKKCKLYKIESRTDFTGWVITAEYEDKRTFTDSINQFESINNSYIEKYLPDFKILKLIETDSIFVHNDGFDKLMEVKREVTRHLHDDSYASNQGKIEVSFIQWMKHESQPMARYYLVILLSIVIAILFSFFNFVGLSVLSIIGIIVVFNKLNILKSKIREMYNFGDIIPGVVIDINPTRIAAMTDMTKGLGHFPVIKIFKLTAKKIGDKTICKGDRVPLITLYFSYEGNNYDYWHDINPYPVEFAISDKNEIAKRLYSISLFDWSKLNDEIKELKSIPKPGLYKIDLDKSDWIKIPNSH